MSPDVRGRSHTIGADVLLPGPGDGGVLIAHGDSVAGYALRIDEGHLIHHYVHRRLATTTRSSHGVPHGRLVRVQAAIVRSGSRALVTLTIDGSPAGEGTIPEMARARTGYTGVDVGCDRGLTVGGYPAPARFTGRLALVDVEGADDQWLDLAAALEIESATQ
ncbi:MAG: hypothetical protein WB767_15545 [Nocardioides sp.]